MAIVLPLRVLNLPSEVLAVAFHRSACEFLSHPEIFKFQDVNMKKIKTNKILLI
jgi:hypothetical protein